MVSFLQAYALQRYLKNLGHNVFLYDIKWDEFHFENNLDFLDMIQLSASNTLVPYYLLKGSIKNHNLRKNNPRFFDEFKNRFFEFSPQQYTTIKQLRKNPPEADVYICGSDQIWNMSVFENARAYFLDFGSTSVRRIAYAASFGKKDIQKPFSKFIKPMLSRFNAISVRESSGKDICSKAGYTTSTKVVDPTFLLRVEDYKVLLNSQLEWKAKKKCLCYFLNFKKPSDVYWNDIKEMAILRNIDMRLVVSSGAKDAFDILDSEYYAPSPYDFITSIKLSDFGNYQFISRNNFCDFNGKTIYSNSIGQQSLWDE